MIPRYYCETCRVGVEQLGPQRLCGRCRNALLDLATEQAWDYLRERDQSLHDHRQRFVVGFGAIVLSVPGCVMIYLRMDTWGSVFDYLHDFRFYLGGYTLLAVLAANFIANKRWPLDPILATSEEERAALKSARAE